jgi:hypothetical protein
VTGQKRSQRRKWCGDREESDVLLLGMPRQRNAAGFLVRRAVEHDQITRLYYFNFQSVRGIPGAHARKCKKPVSDPRIRRCNEDEFGLIGADDDKAYQQRAAAQPDDEVIAVGDGPADYSGPGDRRLVFCLLRDHHPVKISGPERRVRSCGPAD